MIIERTEDWVKERLAHDTTGHDWYHIDRVRKVAVMLAEKENADQQIVELAALLHDTIDDKIVANEQVAVEEVKKFLVEQGLPKPALYKVLAIIQTISFSKGQELSLLEAKIVQDADRLDAIGAIGIARTFQYSGARNQPIYDPTLSVRGQMTREEYRHGKSSAINHFYEKLLQLKDGLHTQTAKEVAEKRHALMEQFLDQFFLEWEGNA
ncbi:HD domain-containing protein [Alkalihalobacillus sp. LMS6]|uniref:HD domain-containing protein n=1 Tax=Bacillaceae TaxID=186817 RepID=UPI000C06AC2B|nr:MULTISPECIES: HD domain-containing protein [Bacillaceae]UTR07374.1 HD domain-containing protein [Alkalihalobacillus sp. LMS6]